jgi:hypothetical protein
VRPYRISAADYIVLEKAGGLTMSFSPYGGACEVVDHYVELPLVAIIELKIIPDVRVGTKAVASLAQWTLA